MADFGGLTEYRDTGSDVETSSLVPCVWEDTLWTFMKSYSSSGKVVVVFVFLGGDPESGRTVFKQKV